MGRKKKKQSRRKAKQDEEFLQHLGMLARTGASLREGAEALGMTGKELEGLFRKRPKVLRTWRSARLNLILGIRGALAKSAAEGKLPAIERLLEELEKVEIIPQPAPAIDFEHLKTSELMIAIGKPRNTIDRWRNESGLKRAADKTYSLPDFIDWFERYCRSKYATTSVSGDPLRDARAEKIRLEIDEKRKVLLDRQDVVLQQIFWIQNLKTHCSRGAEELARLCQAQSREKMKELMDTWFQDLFLSMTRIPKVLSFPPAMERELENFLKRLKPHDYSGAEIHDLPKVEGLKR